MAYKRIHLDKTGSVAVITLTGGDDCNSVTEVMASELETAIEAVIDDEDVRVLVLTGSGTVFSTGTDRIVQTLRDETPGSGTDEVQLPRASAYLADLEIPVIAAINGDAFGPGLELALACDIRIASDKASFAMGQIRYGMIPWDGGTQRLPRLVGKGRATSMILTGQSLSAEKALRIGLVHAVYPAERLLDEALGLAKMIGEYAPIALSYIKDTVNKGMDMTLEQGLRLEQDLTVILQSTADRAEGISSFLEKRKPEFRGH